MSKNFKAVTMGRNCGMQAPFYPDKNDKKKDYEVFGSGNNYEIFDTIRDNTTIVKDTPTLAMGTSQEGANPNKKNFLIKGLNPIKHLNPLRKSKRFNKDDTISRENEEYSKSGARSPQHESSFSIPYCEFPSPTGPVGMEAYNENTVTYYGLSGDQYEVDENENNYEDIDELDPQIPVDMSLVKPHDLPWYGSRQKEMHTKNHPAKEPVKPLIRSPILKARPAIEQIETPLPGEPTEDYMDMDPVLVKETIASLEADNPQKKMNFQTELSTKINNFEVKKVNVEVIPPIRRTIHHKTVHSHTLQILRDEYQHAIPTPSKRVASLSTDEEPLHIKEEPFPIRRQTSGFGYESVPKFKPIKPSKPKVDTPKPTQETKSDPMVTTGEIKTSKDEFQNKIQKLATSMRKDDVPSNKKEILPLERQKSGHDKVQNLEPDKPSKLCKPKIDIPKPAQKPTKVIPPPRERGMSIKILNTNLTPSENENQDFRHKKNKPEEKCIQNVVDKVGEEKSPNITSPVKKVPPEVPEKIKKLPSPQTGYLTLGDLNATEPIPPKPLKSRDSDVETKITQDSEETYVPSVLKKKRNERMKKTERELKKQTSTSETKQVPETAPKPVRSNSIKKHDQGIKENEKKEDLMTGSIKVANEQKKSFQWRDQEPNYYVAEPRH